MAKAFRTEDFEYSSDISLLHGAVISCHRQVSNNDDKVLRLLTKEAFSKTINTITETVKTVSNGIGFEKWTVEDCDCVNRRMHAVLLYTVLKSSGLSDEDMDRFYESVANIFPKFGFDVYLELVKSCSWGKYYIEFIGTLPEKNCVHVLWSTLQHCSFGTTCEDCYLIHCVLQVASRKVYEQCLNNQAAVPSEKRPFSATNDCQESLTKNIEEESKQTQLHISPTQILRNIKEALKEDDQKKSPFSILCYALDYVMYFWKYYTTSSSEENNSSSGYVAVKSVLHTLLTSCSLFLGEFCIDKWDLEPVYLSKYEQDQVYSVCCKSGNTATTEHEQNKLFFLVKRLSDPETLLKILQNFGHLFSIAHTVLDQCKLLVGNSLKNCVGSHLSVTKNFIFDFTVDFAYLLFLNVTTVKKLLQQCHAQLTVLPENSLVMNNLNEINSTLQSINSIEEPSVKKEVQEDIIKKMIFVIDSKIIGHKDALELCLGNDDFLNNESVLTCLERNIPLVSQKQFVQLLLTSLLDKELKYKTRQLQIFFPAFKDLPLSDQQDILKMMLDGYGLTTKLKLPEFIPEVTALLNQTVKISEAGPQVLALFLQSPQELMERIISKALDNSGQISLLVQMLQLVSPACMYKQSHSPCLLIKTLKTYVTEDLSTTQLQNMVSFLQQLLQACSSEELLCIEELLLWCVLPHLKPSSSSLMKSSLQVLQIICEKTVQRPDENTWMKGVSIPCVILCLYQVLDQCITECCGHRKRMVVSILEAFLQIQKQQGIALLSTKETVWLYGHLKKKNLCVMCYAVDFIQELESRILNEDVPLHVLFTFASRKMSESVLTALKQSLNRCSSTVRYSYLVLALARVLSHSTLEEWKNLFTIIEQCLEDCGDMAPSFQSTEFVITGKLVQVVHTVVDALIVLSKWSGASEDSVFLDWPFLFSSLTISLKGYQEEESLEVLIKLFSELCRLEGALENDRTSQLAVSLLDIASIFNSKVKSSTKPDCDLQAMKMYLSSILQLVKDADIRCNVLAKLEE